MMKLRINPLVVKDLKEIREYIADDNVEKATEAMIEAGVEEEIVIKMLQKYWDNWYQMDAISYYVDLYKSKPQTLPIVKSILPLHSWASPSLDTRGQNRNASVFPIQ